MCETKDRADLRAAYQGAIDLASAEQNNVWAMSNALLVANSIVLIAFATGLTIHDSEFHEFLAKGLPIAGILLCVAWLGMIQRGYAYQDFYVMSAQILEQNLIGDASTLWEGNRIPDRWPLPGRISNRWFVQLMIGVFLAGYVYLLCPIGYKVVLCLFLLYGMVVIVDGLVHRCQIRRGSAKANP